MPKRRPEPPPAGHKNMKTIGIIGGFGPEATSECFLRLVALHRKTHHGAQPQIIIRNVSVPKNLEHDLLVRGKGINKFAPLLTGAAQQLEQNGADIIILPCNTLHVHENAIRKSVGVPFVSIIDEVARFVRKQKIVRMGFLGSQITVRENLFKKKTKRTTFVFVPPALQKRIDRGLDFFIGNQGSQILQESLHESFIFFEKNNIRDILVACTDFHYFCPSDIRIHDSLDILVEATVNML